MQPQANHTTAQYSFNVESSGNAHTITYSKAKFGAGIMLATLFPAMLVSFFITMGTKGDLSGWVVLTLIICGSTFLILNLSRSQGRFSVISDAAIILNGRQYNKDHINRFYVKAPSMQEEVHPVVVHNPMPYNRFGMGGDRVNQIGMGAATAVTGAVSIVAQAGGLMMQSSKKSIHKHYRKINYSIGFMYGEKEVKLAGGLTENTADVLLDKVMQLSSTAV
jgi:hypothetical protein